MEAVNRQLNLFHTDPRTLSPIQSAVRIGVRPHRPRSPPRKEDVSAIIIVVVVVVHRREKEEEQHDARPGVVHRSYEFVPQMPPLRQAVRRAGDAHGLHALVLPRLHPRVHGGSLAMSG